MQLNSVPGTYYLHSCANVTFNIKYGPTCTSNNIKLTLIIKCTKQLNVKNGGILSARRVNSISAGGWRGILNARGT